MGWSKNLGRGSMRKGGAESSIDWLSSRFVGRKGKRGVTQYTHLQGTDLFVEKGKKLGGRVVCAALDLLPSHRKKVQREQIWDQRIYAAWLHTLHHPFIRVDAHGAGMSHTAILLLLI